MRTAFVALLVAVMVWFAEGLPVGCVPKKHGVAEPIGTAMRNDMVHNRGSADLPFALTHHAERIAVKPGQARLVPSTGIAAIARIAAPLIVFAPLLQPRRSAVGSVSGRGIWHGL